VESGARKHLCVCGDFLDKVKNRFRPENSAVFPNRAGIFRPEKSAVFPNRAGIFRPEKSAVFPNRAGIFVLEKSRKNTCGSIQPRVHSRVFDKIFSRVCSQSDRKKGSKKVSDRVLVVFPNPRFRHHKAFSQLSSWASLYWGNSTVASNPCGELLRGPLFFLTPFPICTVLPNPRFHHSKEKGSFSEFFLTLINLSFHTYINR